MPPPPPPPTAPDPAATQPSSPLDPPGSPPSPPPEAPVSSPEAPPPARRPSRAGHVVALVAGCLLLLPGLGMFLGGAAGVAAQAFATDDGYFRFTPDRVESDGVAVAATDLWLDGDESDDDVPGWVMDFVDADLRLRVDPATPSDEIFVGIARAGDVERYLADAAYSDVVEMKGRLPVYETVSGDDSIADPLAQGFWVVTSSGDGEQELEWDVRGGRWSVVVMNADGSPGVAADVEVGIRSGALTPIVIVLMVTGGIALIGGVVLITVGARGIRRR